MGKVSKNARVNRGSKEGGKSHVKIVVSEKNPVTGQYSYKEKIIHRDQLDEALKGF
ncbi:MAG: DUF4295 family protein [Sphingobacteriales bacterium]|nr:MAG: DUF4295 family protein [Sphingobacteriales bacterium]